MESCNCNFNQLNSFESQPKMKYFECSSNQLTSFPVQPNMEEFYAPNNPFTSFARQPKLTYYPDYVQNILLDKDESENESSEYDSEESSTF